MGFTSGRDKPHGILLMKAQRAMIEKILCSDQHITGNGLGGFSVARNPELFMDFMDWVGDRDIMFLGDLFDLWLDNFRSIMEGPHRSIVQRIIKKENKWFAPGNHDLHPSLMRKHVFKRPGDIAMFFDLYGWRLMHGHQADPLLDTREERWIAATASKIVQAINFGPLNQLRDWAASSDRTNGPMINTLKDKGRKYIVGHSHTPLWLKWFVSEGAQSGGEFSYAILYEDGSVVLRRFP